MRLSCVAVIEINTEKILVISSGKCMSANSVFILFVDNRLEAAITEERNVFKTEQRTLLQSYINLSRLLQFNFSHFTWNEFFADE